YGRQKSPEVSPKRPQRSPGSRLAPRSPPAPSTRPQKPSASACSIPATCLFTIFIIALAAGRVRDRRLWYAPWVFPGEHAAAAGLATSGTLSHWFREQFARDLDPVTAVITLAAEAEASPPGARGLVVLPYFSGERTPIPDPRAHGVIFGLT